MAYFRLDPFGELRADMRNAILSALIANANRDRKRRRRPFKPAEFMPQFDKEPQSGADMLQMAVLLNEALGGKDLRPRPSPPPSFADSG